MPVVARLAALSVAILIGLSAAAAQQPASERPFHRTMAITGTGEVMAKPDMARVTLGVTSHAATAREAVMLNNQDMQAVIAALEGAGIASADIQTAMFQVQPRYTHDPRGTEPPRVVGYTASNQVSVTLRDLDTVGAVLDRAVAVGSNEVHGIVFEVSNPEPLLDEARQKAVSDAVRKAEVYAAAAGVNLGNILSITEHGGGRPPRPMYRNAAADVAMAVPVEPGEESLSVSVAIVWSLQD